MRPAHAPDRPRSSPLIRFVTDEHRHDRAALKEKAALLNQEVAEMTMDSAHNLQEPAQEGLAQIKSTGVDALQTVKEESSFGGKSGW